MTTVDAGELERVIGGGLRNFFGTAAKYSWWTSIGLSVFDGGLDVYAARAAGKPMGEAVGNASVNVVRAATWFDMWGWSVMPRPAY
jgi:hypothetical protein